MIKQRNRVKIINLHEVKIPLMNWELNPINHNILFLKSTSETMSIKSYYFNERSDELNKSDCALDNV